MRTTVGSAPNGRNEELLGRAVASFRDKVIIGTKFTVDLTKNPPINDNRPERVKAACEGSLRRLKTDVIDLYHQHRIDRSVPIEDVAGAVADLIKEGKVRRFALSEVGAETIRRAHRVCPVSGTMCCNSREWNTDPGQRPQVWTFLGRIGNRGRRP